MIDRIEIGIGKTSSPTLAEITCTDRDFIRKFGAPSFTIPKVKLLDTLYTLADWANNELDVECWFYAD